MEKAIRREFLLAFWKVHILHHAAEQPVVGQWMLQELRSHGYELSPGTLYPLLHRMEDHGWLRCDRDSSPGKRSRKCYFLTEEGRGVLEILRGPLTELYREVCAEVAPTGTRHGSISPPERKKGK